MPPSPAVPRPRSAIAVTAAFGSLLATFSVAVRRPTAVALRANETSSDAPLLIVIRTLCTTLVPPPPVAAVELMSLR